MNPVQAARASAPPTLMRRTPASASCCTVVKSPPTSTLTGFGATALTTAVISAVVRMPGAKRQSAPASANAVRRRIVSARSGRPDDEALGPCGKQDSGPARRRSRVAPPGSVRARAGSRRAALMDHRSSPRSTILRCRSALPRSTFAATCSGSTAKPPSKSALTGTGTPSGHQPQVSQHLLQRHTVVGRAPPTTQSRRWSWPARESRAARASGRSRDPRDSGSRSIRTRAAARNIPVRRVA